MAKFCTKCGKELKDGQSCDCGKETKKVETTNTTGFDFNECINNYVDMIKGIFTRPIDTIKKYATSSNFVLGIIALALNCIVSGIFLYCFLKESFSSLSSIMGLGLGYGSILGGNIELPFMRVFLMGLAFMIVGFAVTAIMIYVIAGVILKDKIDIKKAFALVGTCSVFTTVTTIVAIILTYMSIKLMAIVLLIAGIFYLTYLGQGISNTTKIDSNKVAFVFVPAIAVATFVVVYILPKILF